MNPSGTENTAAVTASEAESRAVEARWRQFVRGRDVECPGCGYNLRGLDGRTCPECGGRLDPCELMFAGPDVLSLCAIIRHTGVPGALAFGAAAHVFGLVVAPGVYSEFLRSWAPSSGAARLDLAATCVLLGVAGAAWCLQRWRHVLRGPLADPAIQVNAAWVCWAAAAFKMLVLAACLLMRFTF